MIELLLSLSVVLVSRFSLLEHDWCLNVIKVAKEPPVLNGASGHPYPLFRHASCVRKIMIASYLLTHLRTWPATLRVLSPKGNAISGPTLSR
jgi:hypothetical protein